MICNLENDRSKAFTEKFVIPVVSIYCMHSILYFSISISIGRFVQDKTT